MKDKIESMLKSMIGLRKLSVMFLILSIGCVFRVKGYINGAEMVDLIKTTGIAFFGSNLMSKFLTK